MLLGGIDQATSDVISKVKIVVRVTPTKDSAITHTGSHVAKSFHTFIYSDLGGVWKCMIRLVDTGEAKNSLFPHLSRMIQCAQNYFYRNVGVYFLFVPKCDSKKYWEQVGKMLTTQFRGQLSLFDPELYSIGVFYKVKRAL